MAMIPGQLPRRAAFILLEVMIAIMIVGVTMVAILRGFVVAYDTLSRVRMNETAMMLARTVLDDIILEPYAEGDYEGRFTDDPRFGEEFAGWYWEVWVESDEPRYSYRPQGTLMSDLERVYIARVMISFDLEEAGQVQRRGRRTAWRGPQRRVYVDVQTILMEPDVFSPQAIERNQLF